MCDNQEVGEDEVIDVEENEAGEEKIRENQNKTAICSFSIFKKIVAYYTKLCE